MKSKTDINCTKNTKLKYHDIGTMTRKFMVGSNESYL